MKGLIYRISVLSLTITAILTLPSCGDKNVKDTPRTETSAASESMSKGNSSSPETNAQTKDAAKKTSAGRKEETISIATWNIRDLNQKRWDSTIAEITEIMKRYDLIAVQEIEDKLVMKYLQYKMPKYDYIYSKKVGGGYYGEYYAYYYRKDKISLGGMKYYTYEDKEGHFLREPFIADFKSGSFDFTLINIHMLWGGKDKAKRREEAKHLHTLIEKADYDNGSENDVILVGDFNLNRDDEYIFISNHRAIVAPSIKTLTADSSSYDNIWINLNETYEYKGPFGVFNFDEVIYSNVTSKTRWISDHRPVYAEFRTDLPDDDGNSVSNIIKTNLRLYFHETSDNRIDLEVRSFSTQYIPLGGKSIVCVDKDTNVLARKELGAEGAGLEPGEALIASMKFSTEFDNPIFFKLIGSRTNIYDIYAH